MDDSVTQNDICEAIANVGNCKAQDIKVSPIRKSRSGLGMAWAQCPLLAAIKVSDLVRIRIGWSSVRAELLEPRPIQCYRCWRFGHVRSMCSSDIDRTGHCFNCGGTDHLATNCLNKPSCMICKDGGINFDHRLGGVACNSKSDVKTMDSLRNKKED